MKVHDWIIGDGRQQRIAELRALFASGAVEDLPSEEFFALRDELEELQEAELAEGGVLPG